MTTLNESPANNGTVGLPPSLQPASSGRAPSPSSSSPATAFGREQHAPPHPLSIPEPSQHSPSAASLNSLVSPPSSAAPSLPSASASPSADGEPTVIHWRNVGPEITLNDLATLASQFGTVDQVVMLKAKNQALLQFVEHSAAAALIAHYSTHDCRIRSRNIYPQFSTHQTLTGGEPASSRMVASPMPAAAAAAAAAAALHTPSSAGSEMRAQPPSCILLVTIQNPLYPITADVLAQVFTAHGPVEKIVIFNKSAGLQALVQFAFLDSAINAKTMLQGQNIYAGSCTLHIQFSNLPDLKVNTNSERTRDFTNPTLPTLHSDTMPMLGGNTSQSIGVHPATAAAAAAAATATHMPTGPAAFHAAAAAAAAALGPNSYGVAGAPAPARAGYAQGQPGAVGQGPMGALTGREVGSRAPSAGSGSTSGGPVLHQPTPAASVLNDPARIPSSSPPLVMMGHHGPGYMTSQAHSDLVSSMESLSTNPSPMPSLGNPASFSPPTTKPTTPTPPASLPGTAPASGASSVNLSPSPSNGTMSSQTGAATNASSNSSVPVFGLGADRTVLIVSNLSPEHVNCETLFNLFSNYGNIVRVKIMYKKPDHALIQLGDNMQATAAMTYLKGLHLFGKPLEINFSKHAFISPPMDSDDDHFRDFSASPLNRFIRPSSKNYRHICAPGHMIHVSNVADTVNESRLRTILEAYGTIVAMKFFEANARRQALVQFASIDSAADATAACHNMTIDNMPVRVSFSRNSI